MRLHRALRATIVIALLQGSFALSSQAAVPALAIVAPATLRQGDPLLAWAVASSGGAEASPSASPEAAAFVQMPEARLLGPGGKVAARSRCFDARSLFADALAGLPPAGIFGALFALPGDLAPGAYSLAIGETMVSVSIEARDFPVDTVKLDEPNTKIRTESTKRKDDEAKRLYAILLSVDDAALYADGSPFLFPAEGGFQSSGFGDKRKYLYSTGRSETTMHAGIDWAVVKGTEVRACERGKVVLAETREVTGNTLVVEHLPGLYSLYFHLSSFAVAEGQMVERGQLIAHSGSTGLSTGPHLHWELRAKGDAVDPEYWLSRALLDKDAIKATIVRLIEGG
jgi:murein DD-endopeptidase MepM/ murein hydrolase activator NlpD